MKEFIAAALFLPAFGVLLLLATAFAVMFTVYPGEFRGAELTIATPLMLAAVFALCTAATAHEFFARVTGERENPQEHLQNAKARAHWIRFALTASVTIAVFVLFVRTTSAIVDSASGKSAEVYVLLLVGVPGLILIATIVVLMITWWDTQAAPFLGRAALFAVVAIAIAIGGTILASDAGAGAFCVKKDASICTQYEESPGKGWPMPWQQVEPTGTVRTSDRLDNFGGWEANEDGIVPAGIGANAALWFFASFGLLMLADAVRGTWRRGSGLTRMAIAVSAAFSIAAACTALETLVTRLDVWRDVNHVRIGLIFSWRTVPRLPFESTLSDYLLALTKENSVGVQPPQFLAAFAAWYVLAAFAVIATIGAWHVLTPTRTRMAHALGGTLRSWRNELRHSA